VHIAILVKDAIADLFNAIPAINEIIPFQRETGTVSLLHKLRKAQNLQRRCTEGHNRCMQEITSGEVKGILLKTLRAKATIESKPTHAIEA
jgi:hypothetical protein